jgi:hypothetical protein
MSGGNSKLFLLQDYNSFYKANVKLLQLGIKIL